MNLLVLLCWIFAAFLVVAGYRKLHAGSGWAALIETALGILGAGIVDAVVRLSTPPLLHSALARIGSAAAGGVLLAMLARVTRPKHS